MENSICIAVKNHDKQYLNLNLMREFMLNIICITVRNHGRNTKIQNERIYGKHYTILL